jgi:hypothetical protein
LISTDLPSVVSFNANGQRGQANHSTILAIHLIADYEEINKTLYRFNPAASTPFSSFTTPPQPNNNWHKNQQLCCPTQLLRGLIRLFLTCKGCWMQKAAVICSAKKFC